MTAYWLTGDTRKIMADLPAGSVDLVLSSPPFLALRSYLPDDDLAKQYEIGSEATPADFIDTLLDVTEACARLLAPHGTLAIELGDTYAGSGGAVGDYKNGGLRDGQPKFRAGKRSGNQRNDKVEMAAQGIISTTSGERARANKGAWPMNKSLALIPESYRLALAYGRNPHNGRTTDPWRIRNVIRWVRPNPPVGALGDKFRPATSEIVIACKARDRWFDLDAVRSAPGPPSGSATPGLRKDTGARNDDGAAHMTNNHPAGSPPLDWWQISPGGYPGSHYAVYPPELCIRPIEAMCPRRVCRTCDTPSRRLADSTYEGSKSGLPYEPKQWASGIADGKAAHSAKPPDEGARTIRTTTGWSTCGCPGADGIRLDGYHTGTGWRPGIVLDPFAGSGTTLAVATGHGRDAIGIDLDARNTALARERIGMWMQETTAADMAEAARRRATVRKGGSG